MNFRKSQEKFDQFSWSKNDSNFLDFKHKVFKRHDNRDFCPVKNLTIGEADFNCFKRLRKQLVIAAENFGSEEKFSPVLIPTMCKDMYEEFKLAHKEIDIADQANRKICVTLLRYNLEEPKSSYAQVRLYAKEKEDYKFEQNVFVNYKLEDFTYLLDVVDSVYDKTITIKPKFVVL